jgi:8-oxo-dGTP pyrophosphatase MutT (NUDIX family)
MRRSEAAVALIRRIEDGATLWLAQWNAKWGAYHFVSGHKRPEETFRECLEREVAEELGLRADIEFRAAAEPSAHLEFTAYSESAAVETTYTMELFEVELEGDGPRRAIAGDPRNRWLTEAEIGNARAAAGRPVSATMKRLLTEGLHRALSPDDGV